MNLFEQDASSPALAGVTQIEATARLALRLAARCVPTYDSRFSRKDFTRPQLLACVLLRAAFALTYRGLCDLLRAAPGVREALGLSRTPHFTTIESCANAPGMLEVAQGLLTELMRRVGGGQRPVVEDTAMDSTGLGATVASVYFEEVKREKAAKVVRRRARPGAGDAAHQRRHNTLFVKVSVVILCGLLLPAGVVVSMGRSNDNQQSAALVEQLAGRVKARRLYADAGYDSEPLHELCRDKHGIESVIPPVIKAADGRAHGRYRSQMRPLPAGYGRRKHVESFMSGLKRVTGPALRARQPQRQMTEAALRVLAYGIRR